MEQYKSWEEYFEQACEIKFWEIVNEGALKQLGEV